MALQLADKARKQIIDNLAKDGRMIITACYNERNFTNRTFNLHDSYGCCVYYKGSPISGTKSYAGSLQASESKKWYGQNIQGRSEIDEFLDSYRANPSTISLVVAVAMPYAQVLENGRGLSRKYRVISMGYDKMQSILSKYKNATLRTI